ncbi:sugar ABC transporter permease [Microbacterium trichothecenolyticum]|uniref:carbohydrate ABC transporter permease n=1 Tax=Microbacterium trichothecenolyticum TaxID=69370 RepID=UPI001C6EED3C|nr:sugar ABC transporter permease [Microbacterium trichothecenolyticum]MBW9122332.1 sugar ABC transporter permease [Microbacterium trichothecenolyticum]
MTDSHTPLVERTEDGRNAAGHLPTLPEPRDDGAKRRSVTKGERFRRAAPWYIMVAGAVALIVWLIVYPFIESFLLSFQDVPTNGDGVFIGLENYQRLFTDSRMWGALWNTLWFTFATVTLQVAIAWILALLLWSTFRRASTVMRVLFAIPMLISPVVVGILWRVLLDPTYGWIPAIFNMQDVSLLGNPATAMPTMIFVETWQWTPFVFLIVAAGLNAVPEETLEAARLDGASSWRLFWHIIWPLTLPVTLIAVLFRGLDTLKTFDLPYNLTSGGPGTATETIALYLYKQAFTFLEKGYASAISLLATAVMALLAVLVLFFIRRAERKL